MLLKQEYKTLHVLLAGHFNGLLEHFCGITIWGDGDEGRNYISGMQPIGKLDNGEDLVCRSGGAPSLCSCMDVRRGCMAASAYTGPNSERPLFCSQ